jgi:asparagine synthase (glutamine-hydrolysing)
MPGIVGLLTNMPRADAEAKLLRMVQALVHEPFYRTGTWSDESLGVYVGWVVRKRSFSDGMPLWNEQGDVGLVFCGEEFPAPPTHRALAERRHGAAHDGPSYLVHLAEEDGSFPPD